jgi:hypothetical protein
MLYASLTFWLLVVMFSAWGVHELWSRLVKPRVVNGVLLPGTLVAEIGHVLGLLITGNPVQNTALMGDDDDGAPQTDAPERHRIPVIGPILAALLPLVACAGALWIAAEWLGGRVMQEAATTTAVLLPQTLPTTLDGVWELLRAAVTLVESVVNAVLRADLPRWETLVFLYLAVCLTVRMAPFADNRRGAFGAILLAGLVIAVLAALVPSMRTIIAESSWPILSFAVGVLLLLLLISLVVSGLVGFVRILAGKS